MPRAASCMHPSPAPLFVADNRIVITTLNDVTADTGRTHVHLADGTVCII